MGLHLKKEFSKQIDEVFWLPEITTIDEFIKGLSSQVAIDELTVTFELYKSYCKVFPEPETFDAFLSWSSQILSDFNEIDKYLLESKAVFKNLKSIKEIESWSFNSENLSDTQKKFLEFWDLLGKLYTQFNEDLKNLKLIDENKEEIDFSKFTIVMEFRKFVKIKK